MRKILAALTVAALLSGGSVAATATSATAAPAGTVVAAAKGAPKVTIKKITTKTAPYGKKATVKPGVTTSGRVSVSSKTVTVKKSGKTVAKNKKSVKLRPGTYRVTSKVKFRTYTTRSTTRTVTKKKVGAPAYEDVNVRCTASKVVDEGWYWWLEASCTSSKFDGTRKIALNLWDDGSEYWGIQDNLDDITTTSVPVQGRSFSAVLNPGVDLKKSYSVKETTTTKVWSKVKTKSRSQTLVVKQGKRPSRTTPSGWDCPSWAPIKGNRGSYDWIYHVPGGRYYEATNPEECFTTASAARDAGYRASRNG
jgi:hypothetical protein